MKNDAKIGDTIYVVQSGPVECKRPCRVCNGTKVVTLITGLGEHVALECGFCSHGLETPTGFETFHQFNCTATPRRVDRIERIEGATGDTVKYHSGPENCYNFYDAVNVYGSAEEAAIHCAEVEAHHSAEQEARLHRKAKDWKSYAWNAGYHLREAAECRRRMEYHERSATIMQGHAEATPRRLRTVAVLLVAAMLGACGARSVTAPTRMVVTGDSASDSTTQSLPRDSAMACVRWVPVPGNPDVMQCVP